MIERKCEKGHSWMATKSEINRGRGCPFCSNRRVCDDNRLSKLFPLICSEWDYENNEIKPEEVTFCSRKKCWWRCSKGHKWNSRISQRTKLKTGCPYCSGRLATKECNLAVLHPNLLQEWNYSKNELNPNDVKPKSSKKCWWKCKNNHEWEATPSKRVSGRGCPYCSGNKVSKEKSLGYLYPKISKELLNEDPFTIAPMSNKKYSWKCKDGHLWETVVSNRTCKGSGCPYCCNQKINSENCLASSNPDLVAEWDYEKNELTPFYKFLVF